MGPEHRDSGPGTDRSAIYHIALSSDWVRALAAGDYTISTRGATLHEVGFVHCSFREQVESTGGAVYGDVDEPLVVLVIDPGLVGAEVRVENLDGGTVLFPHVYGAVPVGAVRRTLAVVATAGDDGRFVVDWAGEPPAR